MPFAPTNGGSMVNLRKPCSIKNLKCRRPVA
jgi:hypothetical protein